MFQLPEAITVFNAEDVLDLLNKYISGNKFEQGKSDTVVLDASNLTDIDGSGLQLLLSVYKTCENKSLKFKIVNINDEINMLFDITGTKNVFKGDEDVE